MSLLSIVQTTVTCVLSHTLGCLKLELLVFDRSREGLFA
jgi:hypothetical protein